ncbi:MAG: CvpA family protein [Alphaproteobacteria bacterium]|nr:CvpA family protein [Alphaproteobacteria bacterium]
MFQLLDFILLGIMLVSGLLALARGLTRELLSLAAWGLAAAAGFFATKQKPLMDMVLPHVDPNKPVIAQAIVAVGVFIVALVLLSIIGVKISDRVVTSSVGAFDRSAGFLFGLARGLVLVSVLYIFYMWMVPSDKQEDWIRNAVSLPAVRMVSQTITDYLPPDIRDMLNNASMLGNGPDGAGKTAATPDAKQDQNKGYTNSQQQGLNNLAKGAQQQPLIGQDTNQQ